MVSLATEDTDRCRSCGNDLRAKSRFCDVCGSPVASRPATGEHKQVTVLFADVVGSMKLASALDAERLQEIMNDLFNRASAVVQRYQGTVDKFTGDGLMALFGAPVALEDHALRACISALEIQAVAHELAAAVRDSDGVTIRVRVGLNSGEVIAGEIGSGPGRYTAVGHPVGMAPRMESAVYAVTHGGMGATQKALAHGVPVCAVPYGRDQFEVARRVEVAQCGTRLPAKKLSPPLLRTKVREAMTMRDGARRVAAGFAATGGTAHGADPFEQRVLGIGAG
jgi:class 3 adenylate cyclase